MLALALLPSLAGCGGAAPTPAPSATIAAKPGVSRAKLTDAIDALFADHAAGETRALLVLRGGRIVAERYGPGYGPQTRQIGWSMSKTVTALLIGLLVADGRLRLDGTAPVPAWQRPGDPRGAISLRMLLQMRSGLEHIESADPVYASDNAHMLFLEGRDDVAGYAEAKPLVSEPGRVFHYSTATTMILSDLAARALSESDTPEARRVTVSDYLRTRLFEPAGMRSMLPEYDTRGTMMGASMIWATPRDWAKLGELLRNQGAVRGAQLLPRGWIAFMRSPSPAEPGYGAQIWRNRRNTDGSDELFAGTAPADVFACVGHLGQYVIVSPGQQLTVVRLGKTAGDRTALRTRLSSIMRLFPRSTRP